MAVLLCQVGRYFLADAGQMRCPSGSAPVAKDACFRAAKEAGTAVGRGLRVTADAPFSKSSIIAVTSLVESDWEGTPLGCVVHEYSVVPNWQQRIMLSITPHWGTNGANPNDEWQLVCEGIYERTVCIILQDFRVRAILFCLFVFFWEGYLPLSLACA